MPIYRIFDEFAVLDPSNTPPAGWIVGNFAAAVTAARTNGRALQVRPGTYDASNVDILSTNGGGRSIRIFGIPGTVIIRFTGGNYCLQVRDVNGVQLSGLDFTGQNLAIPAYGAPNATTTTAAGLVIFNNSKQFLIEGCNFRDTRKFSGENIDSYKTQLLIGNDSKGTIRENGFSTGDVGIWNFRSQLTISNNRMQGFQTNGILVYDIAAGGNHSIIENNFINDIEAPFGDGQTGNGIAVFRANNVICRNNTALSCRYSGIRFNGSSRAIISGNNIWNAREAALWAEAPGAGQDMIGSIITDNTIDFSGTGINVGNSGFFNDGVSRQSIIRGNIITNMVRNTIPAIPSAVASVTSGYGISVEQDCLIQSNIFDNCIGGGIKLGVAQAARDLICDGNLVQNSPVGIVFSDNAAARNIVVSNNVVRGATTAQIGSTPSLGFAPLTATFNANTASQTAGTGGTVLIADNRAA
jgi:uncharacterized secreted repeat protein (TIGR03808 family)